MKELSRRRFLTSGATALALGSSLIPVGQGQASTFETLPPAALPFSKEREGINEIAGSADKILTQADKAQKAGRHQAVLELCELVLANEPAHRAARMMKNHFVNRPEPGFHQPAHDQLL